MENTNMGKPLNHFSFFNPLEDGYGSKMIQTWLMAVHIGLLLLIPYDDTVKIEPYDEWCSDAVFFIGISFKHSVIKKYEIKTDF